MQEFANIPTLKNAIIDLMNDANIAEKNLIDVLNYVINLFEKNNLGSDYYGYHNIDHELEVTYVSLLVCVANIKSNNYTIDDLKYIFVASLFHDFDPEKSVDKPHEKNVIKFLDDNEEPKKLLDGVGLDLNVIKALILRTVYPWRGKIMEDAKTEIKKHFEISPLTKKNDTLQDHYKELGLSLIHI